MAKIESEVVRELNYKGKKVGEIVANVYGIRRFEPKISECEMVDLVEGLGPDERINMKSQAYPIFRLLDFYGVHPEDYVKDEDIAICILDKGYKNEEEVRSSDLRLWEFMWERGLEGKLFNESL